ncbi:MAG: hypothetical protein M3357_11720, partial [Actinomycetota bacterium]|nr:hypothetical protein [Actinomycetota bacterium]
RFEGQRPEDLSSRRGVSMSCLTPAPYWAAVMAPRARRTRRLSAQANAPYPAPRRQRTFFVCIRLDAVQQQGDVS